ncbi:interferon regulatory factor 3 isoform X2 [Elgaria multicarinata webbii]|uniref:interferon regulatory factor 3 isoform X2 n=1 Tax=Elgaria multicarinata webbii TaxID=159646 RepID=UPI002FCD3651
MGAQRPLIVPWLVEQLNAERYPGVSWLNQERTRFRVPWKHGSRQSVSSEDFQLFEDWAIARGRYRPGVDIRTPSDWKRNFRSALNRKDGINVMQDNSTDSEDPHKVFEILPNAAHLNGAAQGAANAAGGDVPPIPAANWGAYADSQSSSQDETLESVLSSLDLSSTTEENPVWCGGLSPSDFQPALATVSVTQLDQILGTHEFVPGEENAVCLPPSSLEPVPPTDMMLPLQQLLGANEFDTDFEVKVYYRGRMVLSNIFSNVRGLCFVPPGSPGHCPDLADVVLPDLDILNDQVQVSYTRRLLQGVVPGVILRIEGTALCGTRRGPCHVYWSQSELPEDRTLSGELPKEHLGPISYLQQFVQELIGFIQGQNGSPNYTLWFCFGEEWPDPHRTWKKKLIMVEVVLKTLETLCELSKASGASSLNGGEPDLRISDPHQQSRFLEQLREWGERMEVQYSN